MRVMGPHFFDDRTFFSQSGQNHSVLLGSKSYGSFKPTKQTPFFFQIPLAGFCYYTKFIMNHVFFDWPNTSGIMTFTKKKKSYHHSI